MTWLQALLLGLLYYAGQSWITIIVWFTMKPLFLGLITGLILGDPITGAQVGASIQLLYIGMISAGGSLPSDTTLAGILGTALAITGGLSPEAALSIAVPVGLLGSFVHYGKMSWNSFFVSYGEKLIDEGKADKLWIANVLLPQLLLLVVSGGLCTLACYYGATYVQGIIDILGGTVLKVLGTIGGMLPAVGISLTLTYIFKGEAIPFLIVGFLLSSVFGQNLVTIGIFGAVFASIAYFIISDQEGAVEISQQSEQEDAEEDKGRKRLSKGTLRKAYWNWYLWCQACYNWLRMQGLGFAHFMPPITKELYGEDTEERKVAMKRHLEFFNTEPEFGMVCHGLAAAMEEQRANGEVTGEMITTAKTSLMGPMAGLGDTLMQGIIVPVTLAIFVDLTRQGVLAAPIMYAVTITTISIAISYNVFMFSYQKGNEAILDLMQNGTLDRVLRCANIMGCTVMGALIAAYVVLSCGITFTSAGMEFNLQTQLFDAILPKILPLLLTLLCYRQLKKGTSAMKLIGIIVLVGGIGSLIGLFA